jgi:hypothetical protein
VSYLSELHTSIDLFKENLTKNIVMGQHLQEQIRPIQEVHPLDTSKEYISTFLYVVQLLTGELLGHEYYSNHHSKIEPIDRHDASEIINISFSSNQQQLNIIQNMTGNSNPLWNYGNMVAEADNAETNKETGQSRGENLTSNYISTRWQERNHYTVL